MIEELSKEIKEYKFRAEYYDEVPKKVDFLALLNSFTESLEWVSDQVEDKIETLEEEINTKEREFQYEIKKLDSDIELLREEITNARAN